VLSSAPVSGMALLQALINRPDWALPRIVDYTVTFGLSGDGRANSLFNHYNEAAMYLAMLLPLMACFAFGALGGQLHSAKRRLMRTVSWLLLLAALAAIFLTGSRNAWGLVILITLVAILWSRRWLFALAIGVVVVAMAWAVWGPLWGLGGAWLRVLLPPGLVERLLSTFDPSQPSFASTADRLNAWTIALQGVQQRPILGWGLKTFQSVAGRLGLDHRTLPHEHNAFLMLALGTGIPGLLGFLALQIATIRAALQARLPAHGRQLVAACLAGGLVFILSGFFDIFFYEPRVHLLGWLLLGIAYGVSQGPPSWWSRTDPRHGTISP
jgi:O-antigen ligase